MMENKMGTCNRWAAMAAMLVLGGCAGGSAHMYGTPPLPKDFRQNIVTAAEQYLGCPAGARGARLSPANCPNGKNLGRVGKFDCSNFVRHVYADAGIILTGNARTLCANMTARGNGTPEPGDIVCFAKHGKTVSHIGIAVGNGKFIQAATVQNKRVQVSNLNKNTRPPYVGYVDAARRE